MNGQAIDHHGAGTRDARHVPPTRGQRLAAEAADAAEVRRYQTHPDVIALRVEQVRSQVDRCCWAGIMLGLAFTMTNVQQFAAGHSPAWSLPWLAAWVLDPTVSLVLLAILRAEQVTARYQVHTGEWVRGAKWLALVATYVMNTWSSYAAGTVAGVVLHSVPPLIVFAAAEAVTDLRDKLTEAANRGHREAIGRTGTDPATGPVNGAAEAVNAIGDTEPDARPDTDAGAGSGRTPFAEYLAEARAAWSPGVVITPAWVRQATGCSRGLSSRLARALAASVPASVTDPAGAAETGAAQAWTGGAGQ
jgi:hypothetical protein